ncbi:MAG: TonB-dependent receptor [Candidatus Thiodiazotropha sp.]
MKSCHDHHNDLMQTFKCSALTIGLTLAFGADAQEATDEALDSDTQPTISVTASRVESAVQDTSSAITVIEKQELDRIKFTNSRHELMKRIPGYSMSRNLRFPMGGKNYTVNLIDGLSTGTTFGSGTIGFADYTNPLDIERVEVIRGPASALYGSNALGGVINVITRDPPLEPEYQLWAEAGEYQRQRVGASAGGTVNSVGYFIDANSLKDEGARERSERDRKQVSGKLLFETSDYSILTLRAEYIDSYEENPGSLTEAQYEEDWLQAAIDDAYGDEQAASFSTKYEHDLSDDSGFEISYGLRKTEDEGTPSFSATGGLSSSDVTNHNLVALYHHRLETMDSQFIVGVDLLRSSSDTDTYSERNTESSIDQHWEVEANNASPFLQYEFTPLDKVLVSLGARYDRIRYSAKGYTISRGAATEYDDSTTFSNTSPKAGVTYMLSKDNSLWFSYGQGFVVPGRTQLFVGSREYEPNPDLQPEKAENYEIGFRGQSRQANLSYDFALYRTTTEDMMLTDEEREVYVNAGEVRVQGLETMLSWQPFNSVRFDLTHTYADNKYIDYVSGSSDYSGNTFAYSPKHHVDLRTIWMPVKGLEAELEWNRTSDYYTSADNNDPDGQAYRPSIFNLRVSYEHGSFSYWGHVLNLADKKYAERISYSSRGGRKYDVMGPRTIYAGIAYNF